jgi:hypothetical protein
VACFQNVIPGARQAGHHAGRIVFSTVLTLVDARIMPSDK